MGELTFYGKWWWAQGAEATRAERCQSEHGLKQEAKKGSYTTRSKGKIQEEAKEKGVRGWKYRSMSLERGRLEWNSTDECI